MTSRTEILAGVSLSLSGEIGTRSAELDSARTVKNCVDTAELRAQSLFTLYRPALGEARHASGAGPGHPLDARGDHRDGRSSCLRGRLPAFHLQRVRSL